MRRAPRTSRAGCRRSGSFRQTGCGAPSSGERRPCRPVWVSNSRDYHQLARALDRQVNAVQLAQLLFGQRGAEVTVVRADKFKHRRTSFLVQPPVRGAPALLADQARQAFGFITLCQSPHLTDRDAHLPRRFLLFDLPFFQ